MDIALYKVGGWTIKQRSLHTKGQRGEKLRDMEDRCRILSIYVIEFPEKENKGKRKQEKFKLILE